jgi:hypothetical protein
MYRINNFDEYFVFREAHNIYELEQLFRLRYREYSSCKLEKFLSKNEHEIDIDYYDPRARHYGLFLVIDNWGEYPVGYVRVIEDREMPIKNDVFELMASFGKEDGSLSERSALPFPAMHYINDSNELIDFYGRTKANNKKIFEVGSFVLDGAFHSIRLARHLVESVIAAYFFNYKYEHGIVCCNAIHEKFYRAYGACLLNTINTRELTEPGKYCTCLTATPNDVPFKYKRKISRMAKSYSKTGAIFYYPDDPKCFTKKRYAGIEPYSELAQAFQF